MFLIPRISPINCSRIRRLKRVFKDALVASISHQIVKRAGLLLSIGFLTLAGFSLNVSGVFWNDTPNIIHVRILSPDETSYEELSVAPHSVAKKALVDNAPIVLFSSSGKRFAHLAPRPPDVTHKYFDGRNSTFYYRVTNSGIQLVLPVEGRTWK
jgi:hypothetical protein